ncbi:Putative flippase GtrA (transmembrane translocase of bactoprenol-linked glucose) [Geodermatophilus dictyosporus]|uniref:Putative flippase GtrA (Transmembrane translocase of bactoprenol-linked glucose) n=1 Tax=Geodermatophilus dictyosporus TaxID=1523247 RepID=A0A1I5LAY9_9ACTN|nr:GtrA family protein [Geodermatophilus dictyosporus]SFO94395.1 Putative flippase GtrA (transmembrane translocase of bactoprenol-linked glucose) [Geodermatophilus dictyosporus]
MTATQSRSAGTARELWGRYRSFFLYQLIGVSGVLLDLVLFLVLYNVLGMHEQLATAISTSAGITNNFLLNSYLNFRKRDGMLRRFAKFYSVGLLGIGLVAVLLLVFHSWLGVDANIVKIASMPVVAVFQFFLNKKWSFS